jgi:hypothetical protein
MVNWRVSKIFVNPRKGSHDLHEFTLSGPHLQQNDSSDYQFKLFFKSTSATVSKIRSESEHNIHSRLDLSFSGDFLHDLGHRWRVRGALFKSSQENKPAPHQGLNIRSILHSPPGKFHHSLVGSMQLGVLWRASRISKYVLFHFLLINFVEQVSINLHILLCTRNNKAILDVIEAISKPIFRNEACFFSPLDPSLILKRPGNEKTTFNAEMCKIMGTLESSRSSNTIPLIHQ